MFEEQDKKIKLKEAQRLNNDFATFFNSERTQYTNRNHTNYIKSMGSNTNAQDKALQEENLKVFTQAVENENQNFSKKNKKVWKRDSSVDSFLTKQIMGRGLTNSEKIDNFLQNQRDWGSQGKQIPISQVIHDKYMQDPDYSLHYSFQQSKINNSIYNTSGTANNSVSNLGASSDLQKSQLSTSLASYAFSGPPRFWLSKNKNKTGVTTLNEFVAESTKNQNNPQYLDSMINKKTEPFDVKKLRQSSIFDGTLKTDYDTRTQRENDILSITEMPKNKREDLLEKKRHIEEYHDWKKEVTFKKRQMQLLKNAYRSGILSMDGPFVENSQIYSEEHNKVKQKMEKDQEIQKQRIQNMEKYILANPDIDFLNINKNQYRYDERNKKIFPSKSHEIDPIWKSRRQCNNISQRLPTFQNCFGHNLEDQKQSIQNPRSQYLRNKDVGGKNFNPLTGAISQKLF